MVYANKGIFQARGSLEEIIFDISFMLSTIEEDYGVEYVQMIAKLYQSIREVNIDEFREKL